MDVTEFRGLLPGDRITVPEKGWHSAKGCMGLVISTSGDEVRFINENSGFVCRLPYRAILLAYKPESLCQEVVEEIRQALRRIKLHRALRDFDNMLSQGVIKVSIPKLSPEMRQLGQKLVESDREARTSSGWMVMVVGSLRAPRMVHASYTDAEEEAKRLAENTHQTVVVLRIETLLRHVIKTSAGKRVVATRFLYPLPHGEPEDIAATGMIGDRLESTIEVARAIHNSDTTQGSEFLEQLYEAYKEAQAE